MFTLHLFDHLYFLLLRPYFWSLFFFSFLWGIFCGTMGLVASLQHQDSGLIPGLAQWIKGFSFVASAPTAAWIWSLAQEHHILQGSQEKKKNKTKQKKKWSIISFFSKILVGVNAEFFFSWKFFYLLSSLKNTYAAYSVLNWQLFSHYTLKISFYFLALPLLILRSCLLVFPLQVISFWML